MDELTFFKQQVSELEHENRQLRSEVAYLKGEIKAYKWFIQNKLKREEGEE